MDGITIGVSVASFAIGLATNLFIMGWKAKSIEANLRQDMTATVAKLTETMRDEHDDAMRSAGEGVAALRTKVHEVELWTRDNFVRRSDFSQVIDGVTRSIEGLGVRVDAAVVRIEAKIEKLREDRT